MPVRSLSSSILRWPDAAAVDQAVRRWAQTVVQGRWGVVAIGYFGSYARGDWGVGSDLDLVIIVTSCEEPFERRAVAWDMRELPVPTDVLVYTAREWQDQNRERRFYKTLMRETVWVHGKPPSVPRQRTEP